MFKVEHVLSTIQAIIIDLFLNQYFTQTSAKTAIEQFFPLAVPTRKTPKLFQHYTTKTL